MRFDRLWRRGKLVTLAPQRPGIGVIECGAIGVANGRIVFADEDTALPAGSEAREELDLQGRLVTPGLIDCHTHLVFAADRSREFELRLAGADYQSIAKAGGGIFSTVRATRAASEDGLLASANQRLKALLAEGVTTVEIKSGYGLDSETELRMLRVGRRLAQIHRLETVTTLLAAHALPPERE